uniref:Uncharacterized protein n=1 Tax=Octopus bimaculoides TaxID=37653 RepID=A0A0L8HVD8_OCTBM
MISYQMVKRENNRFFKNTQYTMYTLVSSFALYRFGSKAYHSACTHIHAHLMMYFELISTNLYSTCLISGTVKKVLQFFWLLLSLFNPNPCG